MVCGHGRGEEEGAALVVASILHMRGDSQDVFGKMNRCGLNNVQIVGEAWRKSLLLPWLFAIDCFAES